MQQLRQLKLNWQKYFYSLTNSVVYKMAIVN